MAGRLVAASCIRLRGSLSRSQPCPKRDKLWFIGLPPRRGPPCSRLDRPRVRGPPLGYSRWRSRSSRAADVAHPLHQLQGQRHGPRSDRVPFVALLIAVAALIALWIDPPKTLLAVCVLYALSGPVQWLLRRRTRTEDGMA